MDNPRARLMHLSQAVALGAALASLAVADPFDLPPGYHRFAPRATDITWGPCGINNATECGRFEVPLDYHNATAGKASLAVARYRATKEPRLGTLFLNPGGPGESGVKMVVLGAEVLSQASGGQYDLVSWDPRGIGFTHPRADCFATGTEENAFWEGTIPRAGLEARGNFTDQADLDAFFEQVPEVDDLLTKLGQKCLEYSPDTFQYVGTAAAVRDMVAMHDYFEGPDKPIDYWGFSYGTVIGIYFVNMFPDRVGRIVIDGVVDPVYWADLPSYKFWAVSVESTDEAFTGFVQACAAAGPVNCAIATKDSTADSIRSWVLDLINRAYDYRKAIGPSAEHSSAEVRGTIFQGMYQPTGWPGLATTLLGIYEFLANSSNWNTNLTRRAKPRDLSPRPILRRSPLDIRQFSTNDTDPAPDYAFQAVTCADAIDSSNVTTLMVFEELVNVTREVSHVFGPSWGDAGFYCHRWPVRAVERYTGPWNKNLSNPILVIGNEADPITPFISAKNVADALGDNAILVEQDDYGHTSLAMHSNCTISILQNYFNNNKLPSTDQFCGTNQMLFPGQSITKSTLAALSSGGSGSGSGSNNLATSNDPNPLQSKLDKSQKRANQLLIAVIALGCATVLLLVSLVAACVLGRRNKRVATRGPVHDIHFGGEGHDGEGHVYSTLFDARKGEKGGYAPVST